VLKGWWGDDGCRVDRPAKWRGTWKRRSIRPGNLPTAWRAARRGHHIPGTQVEPALAEAQLTWTSPAGSPDSLGGTVLGEIGPVTGWGRSWPSPGEMARHLCRGPDLQQRRLVARVAMFMRPARTGCEPDPDGWCPRDGYVAGEPDPLSAAAADRGPAGRRHADSSACVVGRCAEWL